MWEIGEPCPEFSIRSDGTVVTTADVRGSWFVLLHCGRPCMPGCSACIDRFATLALHLKERDCRLVVALDAPDAALTATMSQRARRQDRSWTLGRWRGPLSEACAGTRALVVDPAGVIRARADVPSSGAVRGQLLLELVDRARLGTAQPVEVLPVAGGEAFGCVDWFDFNASARGADPAHTK